MTYQDRLGTNARTGSAKTVLLLLLLFPRRLWCTNQTEYFDLQKDPYELDNQAGVKGEHADGEFSEMKRLLVRAEKHFESYQFENGSFGKIGFVT